MESVRPAWLVNGLYQCSYCGRDLRVLRSPDGSAGFRQGWMPDGDRMVYRHAHRRGTNVTVRNGDGARVSLGWEAAGEPVRTFPTPAVARCPNRNCDEDVLIS